MVTLYKHNQAAYEAASEKMLETGRAVVIHPTGTGKSFIGFKLCEDNPDKTVLWLSPSEYIYLDNQRDMSEELFLGRYTAETADRCRFFCPM